MAQTTCNLFYFFRFSSFCFNFFGSFLFMSNSWWSSLFHFSSLSFLGRFLCCFHWTCFLNWRLLLFFMLKRWGRFNWSFRNLFYFFFGFWFSCRVFLRTWVLFLSSWLSLFFLWRNLCLRFGGSWFSLKLCWCLLCFGLDSRFWLWFWLCNRFRFRGRLLNRFWFDLGNLLNNFFSWNNFGRWLR